MYVCMCGGKVVEVVLETARRNTRWRGVVLQWRWWYKCCVVKQMRPCVVVSGVVAGIGMWYVVV